MYKNNIDLIGFIGSDPETRFTSNGIALTSFSLATKSSWKYEAGSYESRTEWHRIVAWGKLAESAAKLSKGAHIEVEGELGPRTYPKEVAVGQKPSLLMSRSAKYTSAPYASSIAPSTRPNPKSPR